MVTRRVFLGFFALGGLVALLKRKLGGARPDHEAMFWQEDRSRGTGDHGTGGTR